MKYKKNQLKDFELNNYNMSINTIKETKIF